VALQLGRTTSSVALKLGATVRCRVMYLVLGGPGQAVFSKVRATTSRKGRIGLGIASKLGGSSGILKDVGGN
jgi:hypothetical protein